jgi:hypothetical protein
MKEIYVFYICTIHKHSKLKKDFIIKIYKEIYTNSEFFSLNLLQSYETFLSVSLSTLLL